MAHQHAYVPALGADSLTRLHDPVVNRAATPFGTLAFVRASTAG